MLNINDIHSEEHFRSVYDNNKILFFTIALEKHILLVLIRIAVSTTTGKTEAWRSLVTAVHTSV